MAVAAVAAAGAVSEPMPVLSPDLASPAEIAAWMALRQQEGDVITGGLIDRFLATLGRPLCPRRAGDRAQNGPNGDLAPLGLHWCLAPEVAEAAALSPDGLPADGGIIPPIRLLTSRMWGGGEIHFLRPLRADDRVERVSRLAGLTEKAGRSGRLVFARFQHDYRAGGSVCVSETQTIAFRDPAATPPAEAAAPDAENLREARWDFSRTVTTTAPMLFRFSALTFNPHRIHYDQPYATGVEGYPGLLVQGTLTAALLLDACAEQAGPGAIASFRVKAERPAFCGIRLTLAGRIAGGEMTFAALDEAGRPVMQGSASLRG